MNSEWKGGFKSMLDLKLDNLLNEIKSMKKLLTEAWELKGKTDQEILDLSLKLDELINKYNRLSFVLQKSW